MDKEINTVYSTKDYAKFRRLDGNRSVNDGRVEKILRSIDAVGFINAPIICNDKYEIIDGQGRFEACKKKNIPIPYIIIPNLGINACINMNIYQERWRVVDYINSYAARGIAPYVMLKEFLDKSPYNLSISIWCLFHSDPSNLLEKLKAGSQELSEEQIDRAQELIRFLRNFDDIHTNNRNRLYPALGYCYFMSDVDNGRLITKVHNFPRSFSAIATTLDAIEVIEDVYNNRLRTPHVYIKMHYLEAIDGLKAANNARAKLIRNGFKTEFRHSENEC